MGIKSHGRGLQYFEAVFFVAGPLFQSVHHFFQNARQAEQNYRCYGTHDGKEHEEVKQVGHMIAQQVLVHSFLRIIAAQHAGKLVGCCRTHVPHTHHQ